MNWAVVPLIIQYGLPAAEKLWTLAASKAEPTQADWDSLKALTQESSKTKMLEALARAGIDPNSQHGKDLLALAG